MTVAASAVLLGACGGSEGVKDTGRATGSYVGPAVAKPRYEYPRARIDEFVDACAATAGQRAVCECTIDRLQSTLPFAEFASADRAIRAERPVARRTRTAIDEATEACRE